MGILNDLKKFFFPPQVITLKDVREVNKSEEKPVVPTIDCTNPYHRAEKELIDNFKNIEPYYPFMLMPDEEKRTLLNCVYLHYGIHGEPKEIYQVFHKWDKKLLLYICLMERNRLDYLVKLYHYEGQRHSDYFRLSRNKCNILCPTEDFKKLIYTNFISYYNGKLQDWYSICPANFCMKMYIEDSLKDGKIFIYHQGELYKITNKKEFEEFKRKTNTSLVWDFMEYIKE